ncbi:MAG: iron ABC transporter substrate-binding protein [Devosia nanyangense]|uniref:Iron ABC transporter substrate-binding protein n=1 Tax=Devosia nanyangense TaxID=1228055 RepID=A0A933NWX3_9HYPH|nr:iron ABC transporter substrate-binding protein [Devosia nanyangense]
MRFRLPIMAGLIAALALPVLAQDDGLIVYNAQHESLTQEWADGFTKATGIKVTLRHGGDTELGNQLVQEGASSPADLFLTENSPAMVLVDTAGLLEPLPQDILDEVGDSFRPSTGNWTGIAARSTVFVYNNALLTEEKLPKSIMDLADPSWKGRWAASPSGADFQAIVAAMLSLKGEEATAAWLTAMKENAVAYRGNTAAMKGVNAEEVEGAVIYHYYFFGDKAKTGENSAHIGQLFFKGEDPGAFVSVSAGGVLKSSTHKAEALAFLKWIAGADGQAVLRDGTSFEYAVGVGAASNPALPPLDTLGAPKVDPASLDSRKVTDLMTAAGII